MARMNVSLADNVLDELVRSVPARRRSEFMQAAVMEKLERERQRRAAAAAAGAWTEEGRGDVEAEVRTLREAWAQRAERQPVSRDRRDDD